MGQSVLIACESDLLRMGLRQALTADGRWDVVAETSDGRTAVDSARQHRPHLVVLSSSLPLLNGVDAVRHIRAELPSQCVVIAPTGS